MLEGRSVNVSQSGLLASFDQPLGIWVDGELSLVVGEYIVNIEARTARIQGDHIGLSFLIETENDRLAVTIMNDYAMSLKQEYVSGERPATVAPAIGNERRLR